MDGLRLILNAIWFVLHGWLLALAYLLAGLIACLLIVTIPFGIAFGLALFTLALVGLFPLGKRVVDSDAPVTYFHAGATVAAPAR